MRTKQLNQQVINLRDLSMEDIVRSEALKLRLNANSQEPTMDSKTVERVSRRYDELTKRSLDFITKAHELVEDFNLEKPGPTTMTTEHLQAIREEELLGLNDKKPVLRTR